MLTARLPLLQVGGAGASSSAVDELGAKRARRSATPDESRTAFQTEGRSSGRARGAVAEGPGKSMVGRRVLVWFDGPPAHDGSQWFAGKVDDWDPARYDGKGGHRVTHDDRDVMWHPYMDEVERADWWKFEPQSAGQQQEAEPQTPAVHQRNGDGGMGTASKAAKLADNAISLA